ncbi:glycosyl hydrolase 2 galactose-binding domain-containing protein, partial [Candidatus Venteria ishoeyi]
MYTKFSELLFICIFLVIIFPSCQEEEKKPSWEEFVINKSWEFSKAGSNDWMPATVPGCVHTDLMAQQIIPDPFFADNEKQVQWIENEDWEYKTSFSVDSTLFNKNCIHLKFQGLDTYADVYLNNFLLGSPNNMFLNWVY